MPRIVRAAIVQAGSVLFDREATLRKAARFLADAAITFEGRCFVLSAVQYLTRRDCPVDYPCIQGDAPSTVLIRGGSVIVNPLGDVLAGPDFTGERILAADLNLDEIAEGKYDLDVTGHYARPDVLRLVVNEEPAPAAEFGRSQAEGQCAAD